MTPSEEFVYELANKTFLPFWSFANPIGKKDKELCDVLVICDNVVIIISVKEIKVSEGKNVDVQYERWIKKAVHASCDQIHGAERYILSSDRILLKDRKTWVKLADDTNIKIFRIGKIPCFCASSPNLLFHFIKPIVLFIEIISFFRLILF